MEICDIILVMNIPLVTDTEKHFFSPLWCMSCFPSNSPKNPDIQYYDGSSIILTFLYDLIMIISLNNLNPRGKLGNRLNEGFSGGIMWKT